MRAFKILMKILVSIINILNEEGFKIYDIENPDYYISGYEYNADEDKIYVHFKGDNKWTKDY